MNSQRIVHLAMTHHNWGSRWRVNSLFTQISFQINLHWTQLRGIENPRIPLRPEDNDHRDRAAGCHAESLPDVVHDFQIRCNFQNRVFVSWLRDVWENFMGPRGLKAPPLLLIPPCRDHKTEVFFAPRAVFWVNSGQPGQSTRPMSQAKI